MLVMNSFDARHATLMEQVLMLVATCNHAERSKPMRYLLGGVLALGNLFNGGTALGGARAVKSDVLGKLHKKLSRQRDVTLLHHLHQLLGQSYPGVSDGEE